MRVIMALCKRTWSHSLSGNRQQGLVMPFRELADKVTCAYCQQLTPVADWPRFGDFIAFCHSTKENAEGAGGRGAYSIRLRCPHCGKIFYVVWDSDPR